MCKITNASQIVISLGDIEITDEVVKVRSSETFSFKNNFILLVLGKEVRVVVDKLQELGELLAAVGGYLQRLKHRSR